MRGHQKLIEMRMNRKRPGIVFVNDYECDVDWHTNTGDAVTVCTAGDVVQTLDLRFLVGLTVSVSSTSEIRAKALFEKCKAAGAETVAACHIQEDRHHWQQNGWANVYRKQAEVVHG